MQIQIKHILLSLLIIGLYAHAHSASFVIAFESGTTISIHKAESISDQFKTWQKSENPLKKLFYTYNYPDHIDQYKGLFYQNNYPWGIEDIYPKWRSDMNSITIDVQGIFYGQLDEMEVACIQFSFAEKTNTIQMGFLAKRIQGTWYPLESQLMSTYQDVMGFFGTFQPELAACLLNPALDVASHVAATKLRTQCAANGNVFTEVCLYETAAAWGTSDDIQLHTYEPMLFKNRMRQEEAQGRTARVQDKTRDYLLSLGLPDEAIRKSLYYFSKNENLKAIQVLYANGVDLETKTLYDTLNQLQETTQYRTFERQFEEKPKTE